MLILVPSPTLAVTVASCVVTVRALSLTVLMEPTAWLPPPPPNPDRSRWMVCCASSSLNSPLCSRCLSSCSSSGLIGATSAVSFTSSSWFNRVCAWAAATCKVGSGSGAAWERVGVGNCDRSDICASAPLPPSVDPHETPNATTSAPTNASSDPFILALFSVNPCWLSDGG